MHACGRAAESALEVGDPDTAVQMARRAIRCDSVSETSWQQLIRGLSASGARSEALRAYLEFRRIMVDELGSEPGPASRALYMQILKEESGTTGSGASTHEVKTLLKLLRNALESFPGVDLPRGDSNLAAIAVQLVGAA
jgi:DNA-binding SARP family transcriptional activator